MIPAHRAYLLRETLVALVINSLLSLVFALLVAHGRARVPLWGGAGMAVDFVPQLFMMSFATTLAVTLLTRKRLKAGAVRPLARCGPPAPHNALIRAVLFGALAVIVLAPLSIGLLALAGALSAPAAGFIVGKVVYGALVSLLIAPPITLAALSSPNASRLTLAGDLA